MKTIILAIVAILASCAEEVYHAPTSNQIYHTQTSDGLAVLVGRSARIEGRELIWSCVYQTSEGRAVSEQREECGRTR
jgi:hypothetical protein